jgi:LacI family transcriptional regulator
MLYMDIAAKLREMVLEGDHTFLPSERALSLRFGVERPTIRRALKLLADEGLVVAIPGKGSMIKPAAPQQHSVKPGAGNSILFVLPSGDGEKLKQAYIADLFYRLGELCSRDGYTLRHLQTGPENTSQDMKRLFSEAQGILFYSSVAPRYIEAARDQGVPTVLVANRFPGIPGILYDNINGSYDAVSHLIAPGCRRVAFLSGAAGYLNSGQRYEGYLRALAAHSIALDEGLLVSGRWDFESGFACVSKLIEQGLPFEGIFAANDAMALGALRALSQNKIRVPGEVKAVGFDNIEAAMYSTPSLSTVAVDAGAVAWAALAMLKSAMEGGTIGSLMIPTRLIVRESSKASEGEGTGDA